MSGHQPRFEVVRTDAAQPWHARFVAANGRVVFTTEQYARRGKAVAAITCIVKPFFAWIEGDVVASIATRDVWNGVNRGVVEVRDVDERAVPDDVSPEGPL